MKTKTCQKEKKSKQIEADEMRRTIWTGRHMKVHQNRFCCTNWKDIGTQKDTENGGMCEAGTGMAEEQQLFET